jgi:hypothetical protein
MMLTVTPAACGTVCGGRLKKRQQRPETDKRQQQTGEIPSHEWQDFTTSHKHVISLTTIPETYVLQN